MVKLCLTLLADLAARDDKDVRVLLRRAGLLALAGRLAPLPLRPTEPAALLALAAAVRVVDGVHRRAADRRADAHPARAARLTDDDEIVLLVTHRADRGVAEVGHFADFSRRELHLRVAGVVRDHFGEVARGTDKARTRAGREFDVVDEGADGNLPERHTITDGERRVLSDEEGGADLHLLRQNDIAACAIAVEREPDEGTAERVVFNGLYLRGDVLLIVGKIDIAETLLVAAALVTRRDASEGVPAALAALLLQKRLMRRIAREELPVRQRGHMATAFGSRFIGFHTDILGELDAVAPIQIHIRLAPRCAGPLAALGAHRFLLRRQVHDAYLAGFDLIYLRDSRGDSGLRRARGDIKGVDAFLGRDERLLGEPGRANDFVRDTARELRRARAMLQDNFFLLLLLFFLCSAEECHIDLFRFRARHKRRERRFRILDNKIPVREHVDRVQAADLFGLDTLQVTEALDRIPVIRRKGDERGVRTLV